MKKYAALAVFVFLNLGIVIFTAWNTTKAHADDRAYRKMHQEATDHCMSLPTDEAIGCLKSEIRRLESEVKP